jgi:hypothetical protein
MALAVVAYQWEVHRDELGHTDAVHAIEELQATAARLPQSMVPLADLYPTVAQLAARSLALLAAIGDPGDVDGLRGFEGFGFWREQR